LLARQLADVAQQRETQARANHRRDSSDGTTIGAQAFETLAHRGLHRAGRVQLLGFPSEPVPPALVETPGVYQRLERLFDEERMTARPRIESARQLPRRRVIDGERAAHQQLNILLGERIETNELRRAQAKQRCLDVPQRRIAVELRLVVGRYQGDASARDLSRREVQQLE